MGVVEMEVRSTFSTKRSPRLNSQYADPEEDDPEIICLGHPEAAEFLETVGEDTGYSDEGSVHAHSARLAHLAQLKFSIHLRSCNSGYSPVQRNTGHGQQLVEWRAGGVKYGCVPGLIHDPYAIALWRPQQVRTLHGLNARCSEGCNETALKYKLDTINPGQLSLDDQISISASCGRASAGPDGIRQHSEAETHGMGERCKGASRTAEVVKKRCEDMYLDAQNNVKKKIYLHRYDLHEMHTEKRQSFRIRCRIRSTFYETAEHEHKRIDPNAARQEHVMQACTPPHRNTSQGTCSLYIGATTPVKCTTKYSIERDTKTTRGERQIRDVDPGLRSLTAPPPPTKGIPLARLASSVTPRQPVSHWLHGRSHRDATDHGYISALDATHAARRQPREQGTNGIRPRHRAASDKSPNKTPERTPPDPSDATAHSQIEPRIHIPPCMHTRRKPIQIKIADIRALEPERAARARKRTAARRVWKVSTNEPSPRSRSRDRGARPISHRRGKGWGRGEGGTGADPGKRQQRGAGRPTGSGDVAGRRDAMQYIARGERRDVSPADIVGRDPNSSLQFLGVHLVEWLSIGGTTIARASQSLRNPTQIRRQSRGAPIHSPADPGKGTDRAGQKSCQHIVSEQQAHEEATLQSAAHAGPETRK
ncbi:hypothetical protein BKA93DRAFT_753599 [Sparassis latifolia]